ncbi:MAG: cell wall-binding repeat-containing protein [Clostridia bacterium]|nr:cell wall-binding repeat-containing protein [Clostridia bacterium]
MKKAKQIISIILVMAVVIGLVPAVSPRAEAATVTVTSWNGLVNALTASGTTTVNLGADIYAESQSGFSTVIIQGSKTLNLNGHNIEYCYKNNKADPEMKDGSAHVLFRVQSGASLVINDSQNKGIITFTAHFAGAKEIKRIPLRHVFVVEGDLVLNGGQIIGGKESGDWTTAFVNTNGSLFTGTIRRQIFGSGVIVCGNGTLTVNGGVIAGRGTKTDYTGTNPIPVLYTTYAAILSGVDATVTINRGTIRGYCGADTINYTTGDVRVYGGTFETYGTDAALIMNPLLKLGNVSRGYFNIKDSSWKKTSGVCLTLNDKFYFDISQKNDLSLFNEGGKLVIDRVLTIKPTSPAVTEDELWAGMTELDPIVLGSNQWKNTTFKYSGTILSSYVELGYEYRYETSVYKDGNLIKRTDLTTLNLSEFATKSGYYTISENLIFLNIFDEEIGRNTHKYTVQVTPPVSIGSIEATVAIPNVNAVPANVTDSTANVSTTATSWFQLSSSGTETAMTSTSRFANGGTYRVYSTFTADSGYILTDSTKVYINGTKATRSSYKPDGSSATYYVDYTVSEPIMHIGPTYVPTPGLDAGKVPPHSNISANFNYQLVSAVWNQGTASFTGTFEAGKTYTAKFTFLANGLTTGEWNSLNVTFSNSDATFTKNTSNGKYYIIVRIPVTPASRYVTITGVNPPLAGNSAADKINHTFSATGITCTVRSAFWVDSQGNEFTGIFEEGKVYTAYFQLQTKSTTSMFPTFTASVNGDMPTEISRHRYYGYVAYEFVAEGVCSVYYELNGGQGGMLTDKVVKGSTYKLAGAGNILAPSGTEFSHWDVNGTACAAGSVITVNSDTVVKAVWKAADYEVLFTADSQAVTGGKMTVDIEAMVEMSDVFMEAYFDNNVTYQWYKNDSPMSGATGISLSFTEEHALSEFCVVVKFGNTALTSKKFWVLSPSESAPLPEGDSVTRVYGNDRYQTAFDVADQLKEDLGIAKFSTVVVTSGTDFADALSGSYLAAVKNAPILLVRANNKTIAAVKDYIKANLAPGGTVYLLGGTKAVPASMESGLDGFTVKRLGGATRYDTNLLILEEAGVGNNHILVCTGLDFADSLSASATKLPILLVKGSLNTKQKELLASSSGTKYVIGGKAAVSEKVENALAAYGTVKRIGGTTRFETSVLVAQEFFSSPSSAVLAYAQDFPDGLSGAPLAIANNAPLILTRPGKQAAAVEYTTANGIKNGYVLGGTKLISDAVVRKVFSMTAEQVIGER